MVGCIIQRNERGLVELGNELVSEPNNMVVTIENFVVVHLMVPLLLWTEGPHTPRNKTSLVLWHSSPWMAA
jgi:hypothetical protein